MLVSFLYSPASTFDFLCTETSDDCENVISQEFRGNPRNPRKIRPIHARWAAPRNGSRESALLNSKALGVRPRGKKQLEISGTFLNFWQAGFDFRGFPGFRGKSSENVPSSENLSRAPVTNRRCGRLRMTVVDHQPDGRGPPACAVWWGGHIEFPRISSEFR